MKRLQFSLPVQLVLSMLFAGLLASVACDTTVRCLFTLSSVIKEILEFFLPLVVFFFVSSGIAAFAHHSLLMILLLITLVTLSNGLTALYAYGMGGSFLTFLSGSHETLVQPEASALTPFFSLGLPHYFSSEAAMLAALLVGFALTFLKPNAVARRFVTSGKWLIERGLALFFIPLVPVYVLGFFVKMMRELPVTTLCGLYGAVFILVVGMQIVWLVLAYVVATLPRLSRAFRCGMAAVPSYLTALGTMSSVATLPVSLACAEQNTGDKAVAQFAMPILANIHLMGDAISVPIFALATMKFFLAVTPPFGAYIVFAGYLCITMLAVSGIPGGGIIVMLPLLKSLFGFTPEMLSVMTALYLLQDGFGTAANVMGDGALVIALHRISNFFTKGKSAYGDAR